MTSILTLQTYSFANNKNGERGILNGCLSALSKHNLRHEVNTKLEIKRKQQTVIDESQSHMNVYAKRLDYFKIEEIKQQYKETNARKNAVGAFSFVFDFKEQEKESFDVEAHFELIQTYFKEIGLSQRFEMLEFVWHMDEKSTHCHILFSGYDQIEGKFAVNDFFSPKGEAEPLKDKQGNIIYKKIANGKDRGKFKLDDDGNKIPKMEAQRRNGAQWLQDTYSAYLEENDYIYTNKKEFSTMLQFPNGIWRRFDEDTKEAVYYFRDLENLYYETKKNNPDDPVLQDIHKEMMEGVSTILDEVRAIELIRHEERKKKQSNLMRPKQ